MAESNVEGVNIGLREIYDTVVRTHEAVQAYGPRLDSVERVAEEALKTAVVADRRSSETKRQLGWAWKVFGTLGGGTTLTFVGALVAKHMH